MVTIYRSLWVVFLIHFNSLSLWIKNSSLFNSISFDKDEHVLFVLDHRLLPVETMSSGFELFLNYLKGKAVKLTNYSDQTSWFKLTCLITN